MASATTDRTGYGNDHDGTRRTPAELLCRVVGPVLILVGIAGFFVDHTFDTVANPGHNAVQAVHDHLNGKSLLGFEVNGWHNVVHILSGLFLLSMARRARTARIAALSFGAIYAVVTILGLIDGSDVLGVIPVNPADNVLHALLSILSLAAGFATKVVSRDGARDAEGVRGERLVERERTVTTGDTGTGTGARRA